LSTKITKGGKRERNNVDGAVDQDFFPKSSFDLFSPQIGEERKEKGRSKGGDYVCGQTNWIEENLLKCSK